MRHKLVLLALPLTAGLTLMGCSTPPHRCQLETYNPDCHSMQDVYQKALHAPPGSSSMEQVVKPDAAHPMAAQNAQTLPATMGNNPHQYAEPGDVGQPVFRQPQVHRVWIAPYVDADGNLRSGEYTYFNTPGQWSYGTLRTDGDASGSTVFQPSKGGQEGVKLPQRTASQGNSPAAPPTPSNRQDDGSTPRTQGLPSITPPAQKLVE